MSARRFFRQGLSRVLAAPFALALLLALSLGANASAAVSLLGSCPMEKACKADCCPSAPSLCTGDGAAHEVVLEGAAAPVPVLKAGAPALPPATIWHAPAQFAAAAAATSVGCRALFLSDPEKSPRSPSRAFLSSWIV